MKELFKHGRTAGKRRHLLVFLLSCSFFALFSQEAKRNILTSSISRERLESVLLSRDRFRPLPGYHDPCWASLDKNTREYFISRGEKFLGYDWPSLLARRYMDFDIDGNRTRFSERYYARRNVLADLCMAEIMERKGRFIDDIINGVWLILEESTWVVPAHSGGNKLHDISDVTVDLFSAETAGLLAWVDYFLGETFDTVTPLIRKRLHEEVDRRVIQSMLDHDDFWYMGYTGRIPNNWNPWIVSNWLTAVLLLEEDRDRRTASVWKALDVLDQYLNPHPADGGCDEGPGYWGHAGASLFDCLFLVGTATNGVFYAFDDPLVRNIGTYICKIRIQDNWYVNFADGSAVNNHAPGTLYRIGRVLEDMDMMAMAAELYRSHPGLDENTDGRSPFGLRRLPNLMILDEMASFTGPFLPELNSLFPDLEVAVAREKEDGSGFFVAIKGGYNNESHNHNDVGSFVLFCDGKPVLVDAGVGTYTAKTFSSERYTIWTMQSAYHNLPTLNGEMQAAGDSYRAKGFGMTADESGIRVAMDIAGAYPDYAYTTEWNRSLELDREKRTVTLEDSWSQERQLKRNQWHFIAAYEPEVKGNGEIVLSNGSDRVLMQFGKHFFAKVEPVPIDDPRLEKVWGDKLWRLTLTTGKKGLRGKESFSWIRGVTRKK